MALRLNESPYQRSKRTTFQIMIELLIGLLVVYTAGIIYSFSLSAKLGVKAILLLLVSLLTTFLVDALAAVLKHKKGKGNLLLEIKDSIVYSYSYITAVIFTLCLPVYINYYVVIIGSLVATGIKHCFGGFGKNIFNPAIIGRIFVGLSFGSAFAVPQGIDGFSGSTLTGAYSSMGVKWLSGVLPEGANMSTLFLGNYLGSLGETFTALILVVGIVLMVRKVINWRSTVFYLGTVAITSLFVGLFVKDLNPFTYMAYHLCLGGLAFGAVFMITDPVTSPTSPFGKALIGVIAGFLTVLIRVNGGYPEGVMYSIAIINIIAPLIDKLVVGKTTDKHLQKWGVAGGVLLLSVVCNTALSVHNVKELNNSSSNPTTSESTSSVVELTREEKLFGISGDYNQLTLAGTNASSSIKGLYSVVYEGATYYCYELKATVEIEDAHMDAVVDMGVVINSGNDLIYQVNVLTATTAGYPFEEQVKSYASAFAGKDANEIATLKASNYADYDAVGSATFSSKLAFTCIRDACKQYVEADKMAAVLNNFVPTGTNVAAYEIANKLSTNIKSAYTFDVDGKKHIGYILEITFEIEHVGEHTGSIAVSIDTTTDLIASSKVVSGATTAGYPFEENVKTYIASFVGKDANEIAALKASNYADYDAVGSATFSSKNLFTCVRDACKQYIEADKAAILG